MVAHMSKIQCLRLCPEVASFTRIEQEQPTNLSSSSSNGVNEEDDGPTVFSTTWENYKMEQRVYMHLAHTLFSSQTRVGCIAACLGASSTDNFPDESIQNTLEPRDRVNNWPCYWSSGGQHDRGVPEFLVYKLCSDLCLVDEIMIQPFKGLCDFIHFFLFVAKKNCVPATNMFLLCSLFPAWPPDIFITVCSLQVWLSKVASTTWRSCIWREWRAADSWWQLYLDVYIPRIPNVAGQLNMSSFYLFWNPLEQFINNGNRSLSWHRAIFENLAWINCIAVAVSSTSQRALQIRHEETRLAVTVFHLYHRAVEFCSMYSELCWNKLCSLNWFVLFQKNVLQSFKLPRPVLCIGGVMKVEFLGRIQKQREDDQYYIWSVPQPHISWWNAPSLAFALLALFVFLWHASFILTAGWCCFLQHIPCQSVWNFVATRIWGSSMPEWSSPQALSRSWTIGRQRRANQLEGLWREYVAGSYN